MRVLITGTTGFIGGFLAKDCLDRGCSVLGIDINPPEYSWTHGAFEQCDVRDFTRLSHLIRTFQPDRIFHLAAQSYPTVSLLRPRDTIESNVSGTVNVFESVRDARITPMVLVACSSAEYGPVAAEDLPTKETHPLRPMHPYGVSKVGQDLLAAQYFQNYSIPTVRIRIFNTTGAGKIGDVCSDLTKRAVEIELGLQPPLLKVGNLTPRRAIIDARDLVRGLWLASERCVPGEAYNLGGENIYSVQELIDAIRARLNATFTIAQDAELIRSCDEPVIAGDMTKIRSCTGWSAQIDVMDTIGEMLNWWRRRLGNTRVSEATPSDSASAKQPVTL